MPGPSRRFTTPAPSPQPGAARADGRAIGRLWLAAITVVGSRLLVRSTNHTPPKGDARAPVPLPSAPSDAERDSYFIRYRGRLLAMSLLGMSGILVSGTRFALTRPAFVPYLIFVGFTVLYIAISLRANALAPGYALAEHRRRVESWIPDRLPSVDVFLPICGEPLYVLRNTWEHVDALAWPGDLRVYVLDDGGDADARAIAEGFGFAYLSRRDRGWMKKAGNLRHGYEHSDGDFVVIFDADFCPRSDFLYELLPYFDDPAVGIVQSPQHFRTLKQQGWLERGAGAVQEFFYRLAQTSRNYHGGAICVGTNAIYRRAALDSNGGTTLICHSEDVHTGFDLRRKGWNLRYVPTCAATGMCPDDLAAFFRQQYRWCLGSMSLLGSRKFWSTKLRLRTRFCFLSGFGYYAHTAFMTLVLPVIPLVLAIHYPSSVSVRNYVVLVPGLLYSYVMFPLWHRCRYGLEAFTVKMIYGWAHLFALADLVRRRPMGWTPTGQKSRPDRRVGTFKVLALVWGGGTSVAWLGAALYRMDAQPLAFAPMALLGALQLAIVARIFTSTKPAARRAGRPSVRMPSSPWRLLRRRDQPA